jgi:uncharacterized protein YtpQ (UPF0354 family)
MAAKNPTAPLNAARLLQLRQLVILTLTLHGASALADALTDRVAAAFNQEDPKLQATIKSDDEIHITAPIGSVSVFLDHVRGECAKRPNDCDAIVKRFAQATVASARGPDAMKFDADNLYPVIRAADTLRAMTGTLGDKVASTFVSRPYISGAVLLYAIDTPAAVRFVSQSDLEHAGLTLDDLDKLAVSHVSRLPPLHVQPLDRAPGLWTALATDGYGTSRLFDPAFWDTAEARAGGAVAVALPTRDWLLFARLDDPAAISRLRVLAGRVVAGETHAVTASLVRRVGKSWIEVLP